MMMQSDGNILGNKKSNAIFHSTDLLTFYNNKPFNNSLNELIEKQ